MNQIKHVSPINIVLFLLLSLSALSARAACDSKEHRAFDFWLGEWDVKTAEGKVAGTNSISLEYDNCVLHERYQTPKGFSGESLNVYDAGRKQWHQSWVDNSGTLLLLDGGIRDGKMVMEGEIINAEGKASQQRISWTPNADGTVRQLWEYTNAEGKWEIAFDGIYTKK